MVSVTTEPNFDLCQYMFSMHAELNFIGRYVKL